MAVPAVQVSSDCLAAIRLFIAEGRVDLAVVGRNSREAAQAQVVCPYAGPGGVGTKGLHCYRRSERVFSANVRGIVIDLKVWSISSKSM